MEFITRQIIENGHAVVSKLNIECAPQQCTSDEFPNDLNIPENVGVSVVKDGSYITAIAGYFIPTY